MKVNQWTLGLAAVGMVSLPAFVQAEEASQHLLTALSSTTISGFVDTSAQWNLGTGNANNPAIPFAGPAKADGFNLNYVQLTIQKPLDAQDQWAAGYRVDLGYGNDLAVFGSTAANSGIKQAYVNLRAPVGNGIEFKMGVFDTIIGYETFERINNPHYTHNYGYGIEPTSHTGLLASYQLTELIGVSAGVANSTAPLINNRTFPATAESYKTYMGGLTVKAPESFGFLAGSTLYAGVVNGSGGGRRVTDNLYVGATLNTPWTGIKVGVAYDYLGSDGNTTVAVPYTSLHADAVSVYASVKATDKLTFLARGEHFEQSAGVLATAGGAPTRILAATGTVQYDLWANVISRLEVRWDHQADGTGRAFGSNPVGVPDRRNAVMIAANVIYKF
jgi:hypothetical protein